MANSRHRHKWKFHHNGYTVMPWKGGKLKGEYRCNCGATKLGKPMHSQGGKHREFK